jgi:hypothetical protein|tara:strand:- start:17701 stop:18219 length:519 start_codon:yes stop_codon:yes gene_type:complete
MALIIEDGTNVTGASSFVTLAEARAFALARGVTLSADDATVEALVIKASDFLNQLEGEFQGLRTTPNTQPLVFPRAGVYWLSYLVESNTIPGALKNAQCQLVVDQAGGVDLQPVGTGAEILEEMVGPIRTKFAPSGTNAATPTLSTFYGFISGLLAPGSSVTGGSINIEVAT